MAIINEKQIVDYVGDTAVIARQLHFRTQSRTSMLKGIENAIINKAKDKLKEMARCNSTKINNLLYTENIDNILISINCNIDKKNSKRNRKY